MVRKQPLCQREKILKTINDLNAANYPTSNGKKSKQRCNSCTRRCCQHATVFKGSFIAERGSVFWHEQHSRPQQLRVYSRAATAAVSFHRHTPPHRNTEAGAWRLVDLMSETLTSTTVPCQTIRTPFHISNAGICKRTKHKWTLRPFKRHNICFIPLSTIKTLK